MPDNKPLTGYPSIDKPWLKYYSDEAVNAKLPEGSIYEYLYEQNKYAIDDLAIIYFGTKYSFRDLFRQIDRTADAFAAIGVRKGDVVDLLLPNTPENIFCIYALNRLGAIADMIDLRAKDDDLRHYLNESGASVAVICDLFEDNVYEVLGQTNIKTCIIGSAFDSMPTVLKACLKLNNARKRIGKMRPDCAITWNQFLKKAVPTDRMPAGTADDVACIFHTSGTTGASKGVMLTNLNFNAMHTHVSLSGLRAIPGESFFNQVPPFLAYNALSAMHDPLSQHLTLIVRPDYRPDIFGANINKFKPNQAMAGPADWTNLYEYTKSKGKPIDYSFLTSCISGSDSLSQPLKDKINQLLLKSGAQSKILEGYGMTEIGAAACINLPQRYVNGSVGIPLPFNTFCAYDNESEKELPYGEIGEICMSGPTVMKGYYQNQKETNLALRKHADGKVWLHSGDIGYISKDGDVFLHGRLKRVIIRHEGFKVSPFQLESTMLSHPNIHSCCVVGAPDTEHKMGQIPIAFIVLKNEDPTTIPEVRKQCESKFSDRYWPAEYRIIDKLPLTSNGKVDYRALEEKAKNNSRS